MSYERTSSEVLNELVPLFIEYQQLLEKENKIKDDRIARLETEVVGLKTKVVDLKDKQHAIAHILLND